MTTVSGHTAIALLPAIDHIVDIAIILGKKIRYRTKIIKINVITSVGFHWVKINPEPHDLYTHLVIVMIIPLNNTAKAVFGLWRDSYGQLFLADKIKPSNIEFIIPAKKVLN